MPTLHSALAAHHAGRLAEAERLYRRILKAEPEHFEALHCLGLVQHQSGHHERALGFFARALRHGRSSALHNNLATTLNALDRPAEALDRLDQAIALAPRDATLHYNRGNTLMTLQRDTEAQASFSRAVTLRPGFLAAWQNKAVTETRLGLYEAALASCDHLLATGEAARALHAADEALAEQPEFALAHWNAASICLSMGEYTRGWRDYEWRWRTPAFRGRGQDFVQPLWLGDAPLDGRTILLHAEQGFGDTIQFCRYAPMVQALGARVVLQAPAPLIPLLRTLAGVDELVSRDAALPRFDTHCPLMSLPLAFGTTLATVPAATPYLAADPARLAAWRDRLGPRTGPRVGLAWSGLASFAGDVTRSAPLAALRDLIRPGIEYVAVQKEVRDADAAAAHGMGISLFGDAIADFADSAALTSLTDLVVSIDSAPAHLAGALGHRVWLLLHDPAEWRWLSRRDDSPWYPTARLFRQSAPRDWGELASRVGDALAAAPWAAA